MASNCLLLWCLQVWNEKLNSSVATKFIAGTLGAAIKFFNTFPGLLYAVHNSDAGWCLAVPTAAHSTISIHSTCFWPVLMSCCAYSCTQYGLHTQYMLLTHANDLLCLQLHAVGFKFSFRSKIFIWLTPVINRVHWFWHVHRMYNKICFPCIWTDHAASQLISHHQCMWRSRCLSVHSVPVSTSSLVHLKLNKIYA